MKSMEQIQRELLAKARWDGGWPRAVHVGLGCVALAHSQEEYDRIKRGDRIAWCVSLAIALAAIPLIVAIAT